MSQSRQTRVPGNYCLHIAQNVLLAMARLVGTSLLSLFVFFVCVCIDLLVWKLASVCVCICVCVLVFTSTCWVGNSHWSVFVFECLCVASLVGTSHLFVSVFVSVCLSSVCVCIVVCVCVFALACLVEASHLSRKNQRQQRLAEKQREIRRRGNFSGERTRSGPRDLCVCGR